MGYKFSSSPFDGFTRSTFSMVEARARHTRRAGRPTLPLHQAESQLRAMLNGHPALRVEVGAGTSTTSPRTGKRRRNGTSSITAPLMPAESTEEQQFTKSTPESAGGQM